AADRHRLGRTDLDRERPARPEDGRALVQDQLGEPHPQHLVVNDTQATTPFSLTAIVGSNNSVSAPSPKQSNHSTYNFVSWSDGGAQAHPLTAPATNTSYTASYRKR